LSGSCHVRDRCGPSGKECRADDRACQSAAISEGLEILCERTEDDAAVYAYCPRGIESRDSGVVWLLLLVAVAIAVVGGGVFLRIMRKP
jgi:hypothetical protein